MFVLFLKSILEKKGSTTRCLLIGSAVFLLAHELDGGVYQRTKDGKTLVWNNFPTDDDAVTWSGKRDAHGYATGSGKLTWYKTEKGFQTGSLLPSKGPVVVVTSYSGIMVRGKLTGSVMNVDPDGRRFQLTFADGMKMRGGTVAPEASPDQQQHNERLYATAMAPAEGPAPSPNAKAAKKSASKEKKVESPKETPNPTAIAPKQVSAESPEEDSATPAKAQPSASPEEDSATPAKAQPSASPEQPTVEVASIRPTPAASPPPEEVDSAVKDRMVADFKDETQDVLSQVGEATDDFRNADRLESVAKLPAPVSEGVSSLVQRARDFRAKVGYETAIRDFRTENETVDALSAVDQVIRNIAAKDVSAASAKLADFLKSNPEPPADNQKPLWQYLTSIQQLCNRLEKDANVHLQRAESFAAASRTSEAIREYQEAYRIFPSRATAEKIRQLQANSLGL
jgi:hypothetical protein